MRFPLLAALVLALVTACGFPTELCSCSPQPPNSVVVYGTVTTPDSRPLQGALVGATGRSGRCPGAGEPAVYAYGAQVSDSIGRYRAFVAHSSNQADTVCVQLSARRSVAVSSDSVLASPLTVVLRTFPPYDSVRVDFALPPRAVPTPSP